MVVNTDRKRSQQKRLLQKAKKKRFLEKTFKRKPKYLSKFINHANAVNFGMKTQSHNIMKLTLF